MGANVYAARASRPTLPSEVVSFVRDFYAHDRRRLIRLLLRTFFNLDYEDAPMPFALPFLVSCFPPFDVSCGSSLRRVCNSSRRALCAQHALRVLDDVSSLPPFFVLPSLARLIVHHVSYAAPACGSSFT